jgi:predicted amidohydrolase YtcJ
VTCLLIPDVVRTMDPERPTAEAVVVEGSQVAAVGTIDELRARYPQAPERRLPGALLPAFIDPHHHFCLAAFDHFAPRLTLAPGSPIAAVQQRIAELVRSAPADGTWLRAQGYNRMQLAQRRAPTRWELDEVCPDRPLLVSAYSLHEGVLNSAGLAAMGWDRRSKNPPHGVLRRNARGELTGEIAEAAYYRAEAASRGALLPHAGDAWMREAQRHGMDLLAHGITRVGDAAVPPEFDDLYLRAAEAQMLPVTVHRLPVGATSLLETRGAPEATASGPADAPAGHAKLFLDGAERCALCLRPTQVVSLARRLTAQALTGVGLAALRSVTRVGRSRLHDGHVHSGEMFFTPEQLVQAITRAHDHGAQVAVHALGNAAVAVACEQLDRHAREVGAHRPRIEHLCFTDPVLARRVADSGAVAVIQPGWVDELGDDFIAHGLPRGIDVLAVRSLLDAGVTVAGSSDYPIASYDVLRAVAAAAERTTASGRPLQPDQAVTVEQALHLYTDGAAQALGVADHAGRVAEGFDADLVLLSGDPVRTVPAAVGDLRVFETWRRGARVYTAAETRDAGTRPAPEAPEQGAAP